MAAMRLGRRGSEGRVPVWKALLTARGSCKRQRGAVGCWRWFGGGVAWCLGEDGRPQAGYAALGKARVASRRQDPPEEGDAIPGLA